MAHDPAARVPGTSPPTNQPLTTDHQPDSPTRTRRGEARRARHTIGGALRCFGRKYTCEDDDRQYRAKQSRHPGNHSQSRDGHGTVTHTNMRREQTVRQVGPSTAPTKTEATKATAVRKLDVIASLRQPKVAVMLMLGFSSGLPFLLTGNTLGYWLRDAGHDARRDRLPLVGRPRLLAQVPVGADHRSRRRAAVRATWPAPRLDARQPDRGRARPGRQCRRSALSEGLAALGSARARRRVRLVHAGHRRGRVAHRGGSDSDELGLLSAAYQLGYRAALLVTRRAHSDLGEPFRLAALVHGDGGADGDRRAARASSPSSRRGRRPRSLAKAQSRRSGRVRGLSRRGVGPFAEFFRVYGWLALLMLAMISFYRLPEFMMGPMANPFYHDLGSLEGRGRRRARIDRARRVACSASPRAGSARCASATSGR